MTAILRNPPSGFPSASVWPPQRVAPEEPRTPRRPRPGPRPATFHDQLEAMAAARSGLPAAVPMRKFPATASGLTALVGFCEKASGPNAAVIEPGPFNAPVGAVRPERVDAGPERRRRGERPQPARFPCLFRHAGPERRRRACPERSRRAPHARKPSIEQPWLSSRAGKAGIRVEHWPVVKILSGIRSIKCLFRIKDWNVLQRWVWRALICLPEQ
jgi:hypothetical protein